MGLAMTAPVTVGVVWWCVRHYPGAVSLGVWNKERPVWSAAWTSAAAIFALDIIWMTPWMDAFWHPLPVGHAAIVLYLLLVLRSGLVAQPSR
jgi:hypothetical protein